MDQKINHPQEHQSVDEEENLKTRRKNPPVHHNTKQSTYENSCNTYCVQTLQAK